MTQNWKSFQFWTIIISLSMRLRNLRNKLKLHRGGCIVLRESVGSQGLVHWKDQNVFQSIPKLKLIRRVIKLTNLMMSERRGSSINSYLNVTLNNESVLRKRLKVENHHKWNKRMWQEMPALLFMKEMPWVSGVDNPHCFQDPLHAEPNSSEGTDCEWKL